MRRFSIIGAALIGGLVLLMVFLTEGDVTEQLVHDFNGLTGNIFHLGETKKEQAPREEYGIQLEDMYLCTDVIQPNENLGEILGRNGIPYEVVNEIVEKSDGILDMRRIRAGKSYCIMRTTDSTDQVQYFIYEQDPVNYVVYEIGDSVSIRTGQKEVITKRREASGVITSSLWNALTDNDLDPELAISMSEIYAWSIDFYRIQKGDLFKVIFEEKFVDGQRIGIGEIKGALFKHYGKDNYAFRYEQDSTLDYFDENANSLRKAFLRAPLQFRRISSQFNRKRFHPILKRSRPHLGTDYAAPTGTPVWSIGDGVVVKAGYSRGGGNHVEIRHNGTYSTRYLHFSKIAAGIKPGTRVSQGQTIGYVGSTGLATGPHLHFEMKKNGEHVDAIREEIPPGDPIREEYLEAFSAYRDTVIAALKAIPDPVPTAPASGEASEP